MLCSVSVFRVQCSAFSWECCWIGNGMKWSVETAIHDEAMTKNVLVDSHMCYRWFSQHQSINLSHHHRQFHPENATDTKYEMINNIDTQWERVVSLFNNEDGQRGEKMAVSVYVCVWNGIRFQANKQSERWVANDANRGLYVDGNAQIWSINEYTC